MTKSQLFLYDACDEELDYYDYDVSLMLHYYALCWLMFVWALYGDYIMTMIIMLMILLLSLMFMSHVG